MASVSGGGVPGLQAEASGQVLSSGLMPRVLSDLESLFPSPHFLPNSLPIPAPCSGNAIWETFPSHLHSSFLQHGCCVSVISHTWCSCWEKMMVRPRISHCDHMHP